VAAATVDCAANVCEFDGRSSTDENTTGLTYQWTFGVAGSASGPTPVKAFTAPGTYDVALTVKDEWGATASTLLPVVIGVPPANVAPTPQLSIACNDMFCTVSAAGSLDANVGDTISYSWNWGDGTAPSLGQSAAHVYTAPATVTVQLTATDGWGASATTSTQVTLPAP
jgi:PKD repeat protein